MGILGRISDLYINGMKSMKLGKTLWKIIGIKLAVIFLVFKLFFFPDVLDKVFKTDAQKAEHVTQVLTGGVSNHLSETNGINNQNSYLRR